jgi:hypothetical protein
MSGHHWRHSLRDRSIKWMELSDGDQPYLSIRTIDQVLREAHINSWLAQTWPRLTGTYARESALAGAWRGRIGCYRIMREFSTVKECTVGTSSNPKQWVFGTGDGKWLTECNKTGRKEEEDVGFIHSGCSPMGGRLEALSAHLTR